MRTNSHTGIRFALVAALLAIILHSSPVWAMENGFQWWQPIYIDAPIGHKKLRAYLETNPRLNDNLEGINQFLTRTAVGYNFRDNIAFYQGYAWVQNWGAKYLQEQRIYQQFGIGQVFRKKLQILHRFRQEQRLLQGVHGVSNRGRYMLRLAYPLGNTYYYLVGYNELFVNYNSLPRGPASGIDQNRLYCGLGRQVSKKIRAEIGYQWQYINRDDKFDDRGSHILMTQMFVNF